MIENNPGLKQIDVSLALGIKRTNMVALIDILEKRDLVRRVTVRVRPALLRAASHAKGQDVS